ncbi:hypothetical protein FKW77_005976 [Venturia effusa]|uniref:Uncharacterized protein n=1 Tax=Venturia effusa TaxID=50376 RepID=A0A517L9E7_9PEZI|nr:hypothetical protein FKW77_005976 [Venturia effusa]
MVESPPNEPVLTDAEWYDRVDRGRLLDRDFYLPIEQVQQSEWKHWKALAEWGYEELDVVKQGRRKDSVFGEEDFVDGQCAGIVKDVHEFLQQHGYDTKIQNAPWEFRKIEHNGGPGGVYMAPDDSRHLKRTGAIFQFLMNFQDPEKACIIVKDMWSARFKALRLGWNIKDDTLFPKLERSSDLTALLWYHTMGGVPDTFLLRGANELTSCAEPEDGSKANTTCPKYFVMPCIAFGSTNTRAMIRRAYKVIGEVKRPLEHGGEYWCPWPGFDVVLGEDSNMNEVFLALLGSKHGEVPARMLSQHKSWFGQKRIGRIKVWTAKGCAYNLLFEVVAVAVPGEEDER